MDPRHAIAIVSNSEKEEDRIKLIRSRASPVSDSHKIRTITHLASKSN